MKDRPVDLPADVKNLFFIGVGGVSMTSLALLSKSCGYNVSGSDCSEGKNVSLLRENGITVHRGHDASHIGDADMVVYTAAVGEDNPEWIAAKERGIPLVGRAVFLGGILSRYKTKIGVCGMHGKSTTTSMLSHLYLSSGLDPTVIGGAEMTSLSAAYRVGSPERVIFESDEYKAAFLSFPTDLAVCLNVEHDHVDFYPDLESVVSTFRAYLFSSPAVVWNAGSPALRKAIDGYGGRSVSFSLSGDGADLTARNMTFLPDETAFDLFSGREKIARVSLPLCGRHYAEDALAALAAFYADGLDPAVGADALKTFRGTKRRAEYRGKTASGALVFDDYAHHPSEIAASLAGFKQMGKRIFCVFQPHTYSRTLTLLDGFASSFADAGKVIFSDIFAAREKDVFGISSRDLQKRVGGSLYIPDFREIASTLSAEAGEGDVIVVMGAGDICKVSDLLLEKKAGG